MRLPIEKIPVLLLHKITRIIDRISEATGALVAWLTLLMMLIVAVVVILRYFFATGSVALQESVTYLHALVFLMGSAFTLKRNGHVRVDIFYRNFSPSRKALVDLVGGIVFLLPVCVFMLLYCWDYVLASWAVAEGSEESGGLPWIYLLKSLLLLMPANLFLQGIAEIMRAALTLAGAGSTRIDPSTGPIS